jgi:hypothetical protein
LAIGIVAKTTFPAATLRIELARSTMSARLRSGSVVTAASTASRKLLSLIGLSRIWELMARRNSAARKAC